MSCLTSLSIFLIPISLCAFTIGLTYAPCYATVCPEDYLSTETRWHLGIFYAMLLVLSLALLMRISFHLFSLLSGYRIPFQLKLLHKFMTAGGALTTIFLVAATVATTALWAPALWDYWGDRADPLGWTSAKIRLTITGVTGHYADIMLGLLIIPVSRNNLVGRVFKLQQRTLLFAHKVVGYLFLAVVLAHGIAYAMYALDGSGDGDEMKTRAFSTGNPTMTLEKSERKSSWYTTATYNGAATLVIIIITITASSWIRRRNFNLFYYSHIGCSVCIFVGASIHVSTDFYLLLPGLCLWLVDWLWRFSSGEAGGLHKKTSATLQNAGQGWYRLSFPALTQQQSGNYSEIPESSTEIGLASLTPLKSYYLNIPSISVIQNHAFTAAIPNSITSGPVFLFQRVQGRPTKKAEKEWTWRLGALVPNTNDSIKLDVRLEGPYSPRDTGYEHASHIICIVGGTGITAAYSLVVWWLKRRAHDNRNRFTLSWTIRDREVANLEERLQLEKRSLTTPNLTLVTHVSSSQGRLDPGEQIRRCLALGSPSGDDTSLPDGQLAENGRVWVYSSGPNGLIQSTERACVEVKRELGSSKSKSSGGGIESIDWDMAKWEV